MTDGEKAMAWGIVGYLLAGTAAVFGLIGFAMLLTGCGGPADAPSPVDMRVGQQVDSGVDSLGNVPDTRAGMSDHQMTDAVAPHEAVPAADAPPWICGALVACRVVSGGTTCPAGLACAPMWTPVTCTPVGYCTPCGGLDEPCCPAAVGAPGGACGAGRVCRGYAWPACTTPGCVDGLWYCQAADPTCGGAGQACCNEAGSLGYDSPWCDVGHYNVDKTGGPGLPCACGP